MSYASGQLAHATRASGESGPGVHAPNPLEHRLCADCASPARCRCSAITRTNTAEIPRAHATSDAVFPARNSASTREVSETLPLRGRTAAESRIALIYPTSSFPIWNTATASSQAPTSCAATAVTVSFPPMSRACSPTVAKHGVYANTNTRNASAAKPA